MADAGAGHVGILSIFFFLIPMISTRNTLIALGIVLLFLPISVLYIQGTWNYEDFSYCLIVPFVSAYVAYGTMKKGRVCSEETSKWAGVLLGLCLLLYLFGVATHFAFLARLAVIGTIIGTVWFVGGNERFRLYLFPLLFLVFAIPPPITIYGSISFPVKLLVTRVSTMTLDVLGILAINEGNIIYLESGPLEVADACSGMRSLVSLIPLAILLAYYSGLSKVGAMLLTFSAVPVAVTINLTRVVFLATSIERLGIDLVEGPGHSFVGIGVLVVGMLLLLAVAGILRRLGLKSMPDTGQPTSP
jgi:exosortase